MNDDKLTGLLQKTKTIAVVGLSKHWNRPSNFVGKYLIEHGYQVVPVNPRYEEILGQKSYPSVVDIPFQIDMVDCFRKPEELDEVLQHTVEKGISSLWLQIGVINVDVQVRAQNEGITVVMDRCIKIEHARLFGGLNFVGVNTKVIRSRRSRQVYN